jgi:hypothetical protein
MLQIKAMTRDRKKIATRFEACFGGGKADRNRQTDIPDVDAVGGSGLAGESVS